MSEILTIDYSSNNTRAEAAAQRLVIAALGSSAFKMPGFSSSDGKELGQFLADAVKTLTEELQKPQKA